MRYGTVDRDYAMQMASCPAESDGPLLMVNFMKYRERASYADGSDHGLSGRQADDAYTPLGVLAEIGARVVYAGDVVGPDASWDRIGIVRYPSRRSFIEMQSRRDFQAQHVHKEAGMDRTVVMTCLPTEGEVPEGGSAAVRFVALPAGSPPVAGAAASIVLAVEGTIVGDGRRFDRVVVTWGDGAGPAAEPPEGALVADTRPFVDRLGATVAAWSDG